MPRLPDRLPPSRPRLAAALLGFVLVAAACAPKSVAEAETKKDVAWLVATPTGEAIAALGRLADSDPRAVAALEARAGQDVNVHIAAWTAITRSAAWGTTFMKASLGDPSRAELAASALPRKDVRLAPFIPDLENAVVRLSAGKRGSIIAGILASVGPAAHATVERRLVDPKTRGAMCDGIALPEASGDAKSVLLAVPTDARDNPSCVTAVIDMAATENVVLDWIASGAEPGLLGVAAKSTLPCARLATMWNKALTDRPSDTHAALTVPLQRSLSRCAPQLDTVMAELLAKAPRARLVILQAIDPYGTELSNMKATCTALKAGYANGENAHARERAREAQSRGCAFAR
ncbi:MAG: hypothetical protein K0S65_1848 [Labilithrix sp.]|nr:hypothetical protein [Labilithrix sp.]